MKFEEVTPTRRIYDRLIEMSADWTAEGSCYGYRANTDADIDGNRIFIAKDGDEIVGYLFGHAETAKNMTSVMPEGTFYFEVEELYVIPSRRSCGTGRALFAFAENAVREQVGFIMLSTATKNWRAVLHFYIDELGMDFWSARLFKRLDGKNTAD